jgi:AcrR family transcriptional regulator
MFASNDNSAVLAGLRGRAGSESRGEVQRIHRVRIVSAMVEVASESGYLGAGVAPVVARAGVSRRAFYELFDGREECFLVSFEWGVGQMRRALIEAYGAKRPWRERVRHALAALLLLLDSEPELARMCVIEALGAGKLVLQRRAELLEDLMGALDAGAPEQRGRLDAPLLTAEGVVGGAFAVIHGRLLEWGTLEDAAPMIELHSQLMALIALPYLGPRAAGEELTRTAPEVPRLTPQDERVLGPVQGRSISGGAGTRTGR